MVWGAVPCVVNRYDYTFVGKGTIKVLRVALQHEARMYEHMESIQGTAIPVLLGSLDFHIPYRLPDTEVWIAHVMFISWAGEHPSESVCNQESFSLEWKRTNQEVLELGIDHGDLRYANMLWNEQLGRVMLIDFEYSRIIEGKGKKPSVATAAVETTGREVTRAIQSPKRRRAKQDPSPRAKRTRSTLSEVPELSNRQRPRAHSSPMTKLSPGVKMISTTTTTTTTGPTMKQKTMGGFDILEEQHGEEENLA